MDGLNPLAFLMNLLPILLIFGVGLAFTGLMIWMLIDCATYEPTQGNEKLIWVLVIIFAPFGSIIYYFVRHRNRRRPPPGLQIPSL